MADCGGDALTKLYVSQYDRMIRTAATLLDDVGAAEEVVQDAYLHMLGCWGRIRNPNAAAAYMHMTVLNLTRSRMRRRQVAGKHVPEPPPVVPSAEDIVINRLEAVRICAALTTLPRRQRECLTLRYYGYLSELQIAAALRISPGAVKSHTYRGINTLRRRLGQPDEPTFAEPSLRRPA